MNRNYLNRLSEDITIIKNCNWNEVLPYANTTLERSRAIKFNPNIINAVYPLTKSYLQNIFLNSPHSGLHNQSFPDINCANDAYGFFFNFFGYGTGSNNPGANPANPSSGLNPFFGANANLGFNFGELGSWLWLALLVAGGLYVYDKIK